MNIRTPFIHIAILIAFLVNTFGPTPVAQAEGFRLPAPGTMVSLSPLFNPPILKGIKVNPDNPFRFDFILDQGEGDIKPRRGFVSPFLKAESTKLIKYFLASLTIPERDLWVNLSPYEKNRIIPQSFGLTEMGRDLLAEDYMLKQITASLIYPEGETGKKFWKRIYAQAAQKFGTTNIPVNTFNKVWIVPEKAIVYENAKAGTAYVVEAKLKVMLEQDYLALSHTVIPAKAGIHNKNDINALGSQIVREIVIPELTKEVNQGANFAQLRQVYNSLILATWYKKKIKDSILEQVYADKNKVAGVGYEKFLSSPNIFIGNPQYIYQQYLKAFKKGVYNYIKEEQDPLTQETTPRKYFSGGATLLETGHILTEVSGIPNSAMLSGNDAMLVTAQLDPSSERNAAMRALVESEVRNTDILKSIETQGIVPGGSVSSLGSADKVSSGKISGVLVSSIKYLADALYDGDALEGGGRALLGVLQERPSLAYSIENWQDADKSTREERMRHGIIVLQRIPVSKLGAEIEFDPYNSVSGNELEVLRKNTVPLKDIDAIFVPEHLMPLVTKTIGPNYHSKIIAVSGTTKIKSASIGIQGDYEVPNFMDTISQYMSSKMSNPQEARNSRFWLHVVRLYSPGDFIKEDEAMNSENRAPLTKNFNDAAMDTREAMIGELKGIFAEIYREFTGKVYAPYKENIEFKEGMFRMLMVPLSDLSRLINTLTSAKQKKEYYDDLRDKVNNVQVYLDRFSNFGNEVKLRQWANLYLSKNPHVPSARSQRELFTFLLATGIRNNGFTPEFANSVAQVKRLFLAKKHRIYVLLGELKAMDAAMKAGDRGIDRARVERRGVLQVLGSLGALAVLAPKVTFAQMMNDTRVQQVSKQNTYEKVEEIDGVNEMYRIKLASGIRYKIFKVRNENFYYIEFKSLSTQNKAFNRLGAFVEEPQYHGRVLNDDQIKQAFGEDDVLGVGHDYDINDIVRFLNRAKHDGIKLNELEMALFTDLLRMGIITFSKGQYIVNAHVAIISTAQDVGETPIENFREDVIDHEYNHGIYFTDKEYRKEIKQLWNSLPESIQKAITRILAEFKDPNNPDLILREFAAWFRNYRKEVLLNLQEGDLMTFLNEVGGTKTLEDIQTKLLHIEHIRAFKRLWNEILKTDKLKIESGHNQKRVGDRAQSVEDFMKHWPSTMPLMSQYVLLIKLKGMPTKRQLSGDESTKYYNLMSILRNHLDIKEDIFEQIRSDLKLRIIDRFVNKIFIPDQLKLFELPVHLQVVRSESGEYQLEAQSMSKTEVYDLSRIVYYLNTGENKVPSIDSEAYKQFLDEFMAQIFARAKDAAMKTEDKERLEEFWSGKVNELEITQILGFSRAKSGIFNSGFYFEFDGHKYFPGLKRIGIGAGEKDDQVWMKRNEHGEIIFERHREKIVASVTWVNTRPRHWEYMGDSQLWEFWSGRINMVEITEILGSSLRFGRFNSGFRFEGNGFQPGYNITIGIGRGKEGDRVFMKRINPNEVSFGRYNVIHGENPVNQALWMKTQEQDENGKFVWKYDHAMRAEGQNVQTPFKDLHKNFKNYLDLVRVFKNSDQIYAQGWWVAFAVDRADQITVNKIAGVLRSLNHGIVEGLLPYDSRFYGTSLMEEQQSKNKDIEEGYVYIPNNIPQTKVDEILEGIRNGFKKKTSKTVTFAVMRAADIPKRVFKALDHSAIPIKYLLSMTVRMRALLREGKGDINSKSNSGYGNRTIFDHAQSAGLSQDTAMKGGIDFTADKTPLQVQNSGQEIKFHLDPAQLAKLQNAPGFTPVIISIQPMINLRSWLGLDEKSIR